MRTKQPPAPFTDKALGVFERGNRTENERRLIATIREREKRPADETKLNALSEEVGRLRTENERLLVDLAKGVQEGKSHEPRESGIPYDGNNCCIACCRQHDKPYASRWFNRLGKDCVCLKCGRTWEATEI